MDYMLKIQEAACDFSGYHGTLGSREAWIKRKTDYRNIISHRFDCKPSTYLFGIRYCEKMFDSLLNQQNSFIKELQYRMELSVEDGVSVSFVIPTIHQNKLDAFEKFFQKSLHPNLEKGVISEVVVSDIGMLAYVRNNGCSKTKITMGRSWDKTIRENRVNVSEIPEIKKNLSMVETPSLADNFYLELCKKYGVSGIELDTSPDIKLRLPKIHDLCWSLIYPKIVISRSSYCEMGSVVKAEPKYLLEYCDTTCQQYYKMYQDKSGLQLYKMENTVCCRQGRPIEESVEGTIRLIYSEIF